MSALRVVSTGRLPFVIFMIALIHWAPARAMGAVCTADTFVVFPGDTVSLGIASSETPLNMDMIQWESDAGSISRSVDQWEWSLHGIAPGYYSASATIGDKLLCSASIIVRLPSITIRGDGKRQSAKRLLLPSESEEAGYGLYSYLLLAGYAMDTNRPRYLSAIRSILELPGAADLENYIGRYRNLTKQEARKHINITYVPVRTAPSDAVLEHWDNREFQQVAEWVLANYDYARARAILDLLGRDTDDGPYIASMLNPTASAASGKHLFQDQSDVPVDLVALWTRQFQYQAAQVEFWNDLSVQNVMLRMRTWMFVAGEGLPSIREALIDFRD